MTKERPQESAETFFERQELLERVIRQRRELIDRIEVSKVEADPMDSIEAALQAARAEKELRVREKVQSSAMRAEAKLAGLQEERRLIMESYKTGLPKLEKAVRQGLIDEEVLKHHREMYEKLTDETTEREEKTAPAPTPETLTTETEEEVVFESGLVISGKRAQLYGMIEAAGEAGINTNDLAKAVYPEAKGSQANPQIRSNLKKLNERLEDEGLRLEIETDMSKRRLGVSGIWRLVRIEPETKPTEKAGEAQQEREETFKKVEVCSLAAALEVNYDKLCDLNIFPEGCKISEGDLKEIVNGSEEELRLSDAQLKQLRVGVLEKFKGIIREGNIEAFFEELRTDEKREKMFGMLWDLYDTKFRMDNETLDGISYLQRLLLDPNLEDRVIEVDLASRIAGRIMGRRTNELQAEQKPEPVEARVDLAEEEEAEVEDIKAEMEPRPERTEAKDEEVEVRKATAAEKATKTIDEEKVRNEVREIVEKERMVFVGGSEERWTAAQVTRLGRPPKIDKRDIDYLISKGIFRKAQEFSFADVVLMRFCQNKGYLGEMSTRRKRELKEVSRIIGQEMERIKTGEKE